MDQRFVCWNQKGILFRVIFYIKYCSDIVQIIKKPMLAQPYPPANKDYILSMQIALPTEIDIEFDLIRNKIIMLNRQIKSLKRVRDYLLPLLMNGQIKVK